MAESIEDKIDGLETLNVDYKKYVKIIQNHLKIPFKNIEETIEQLDEIKKEEKELLDNIENLNDCLENYNAEVQKIKENSALIEKLEKQMPDTCPICGGKL